jgi:hypothetical protein
MCRKKPSWKPFSLNPKTHNKPPTNNQITNHFVQLNCNAFIQRNGRRTCTPTTPPYTPLHSTEGNYMKPSPPSHQHRGAKEVTWNLRHHHGARELLGNLPSFCATMEQGKLCETFPYTPNITKQ